MQYTVTDDNTKLPTAQRGVRKDLVFGRQTSMLYLTHLSSKSASWRLLVVVALSRHRSLRRFPAFRPHHWWVDVGNNAANSTRSPLSAREINPCRTDTQSGKLPLNVRWLGALPVKDNESLPIRYADVKEPGRPEKISTEPWRKTHGIPEKIKNARVSECKIVRSHFGFKMSKHLLGVVSLQQTEAGAPSLPKRVSHVNTINRHAINLVSHCFAAISGDKMKTGNKCYVIHTPKIQLVNWWALLMQTVNWTFTTAVMTVSYFWSDFGSCRQQLKRSTEKLTSTSVSPTYRRDSSRLNHFEPDWYIDTRVILKSCQYAAIHRTQYM